MVGQLFDRCATALRVLCNYCATVVGQLIVQLFATILCDCCANVMRLWYGSYTSVVRLYATAIRLWYNFGATVLQLNVTTVGRAVKQIFYNSGLSVFENETGSKQDCFGAHVLLIINPEIRFLNRSKI